MTDIEAVYASLRNDFALAPVFADWFEERGQMMEALQLRVGPAPIGLFVVRHGFGDGYGDGFGFGYGDGYGDGYGYGDGFGDGYGFGDGLVKLNRSTLMPEVGKNQLIVLPHGWVICGFVREQSGPYSFVVENAFVVCRTGGVPWDELADGKRRTEATYRKWGTVTIGPQFVMSREWVGKLPDVKS